MKTKYYQAHIVVDGEAREDIENITRGQSASMDNKAEQLRYAERRKRVKSSRAGGIAKMRKTTERANKVKEMLYTKFRGNRDNLQHGQQGNFSEGVYNIHAPTWTHRLNCIHF